MDSSTIGTSHGRLRSILFIFFTLTGVASTVIWNDEKETDGSYDPLISQTPGNKSEADEDDGLVPIV